MSKCLALLVMGVSWVTPARAERFLINGIAAPRTMFRSVVDIGGCTAAKVGPRHFLIAGHCLFGGPGTYRQPSRISVGTTQTDRPESLTLNVRKVSLHPTWEEGCRKISCSGWETGTADDVPGKADIALIEVEDLTPQIPAATLDFAPVAPGEKVTLTGLGCTRGIGVGASNGLRYAETRAIEIQALTHPGSLYASTAETAFKSYFVTPGKALESTAASLCPGDSGGPVFRTSGGDTRVIGVNADYTFDGEYEASGAIARTNLHTRIEDGSLHGIGVWLRSLITGT